MIQAPHDLNFLDQTLLAVSLAVGRFLREGLDGVACSIFQFLRQVDGCEIALADLLDGLELLMEAPLVDLLLEEAPPVVHVGYLGQAVRHGLLAALELDFEGLLGEGELEVEIKLDGLAGCLITNFD